MKIIGIKIEEGSNIYSFKNRIVEALQRQSRIIESIVVDGKQVTVTHDRGLLRCNHNYNVDLNFLQILRYIEAHNYKNSLNVHEGVSDSRKQTVSNP